MPRGGADHVCTEKQHPPAICPPRPRQRPSPFLRAGRSPFRFVTHLRQQLACVVAKRRKKKIQIQIHKRKQQQRPAASLLAETILSRVPYRSLCRFRCVSRSWHALCSDPRVLRRSPQTLSGFFGHSRDARRCGSICYSCEGLLLGFRNLSGRGRPMIDPSLRFLRKRGYECVTLIHCCNGILLCSDRRPSPAEYIVCNPATEEVWAVLPVPISHGDPRDNISCLCFDPAIPSYFAVFVIPSESESDGVEVYSSETGRWASLLSQWSHHVYGGDASECVFFNGTLHFSCYDSSSIVTLDTRGKTWGGIQMPEGAKGAVIGQSQGRLHLMLIDYYNDRKLSVWVLEDYASGQWTLKHTVDFLSLLGRAGHMRSKIYTEVAIHPESNLVFFTGGEAWSWSLMSYDMDSRKVQHISSHQSHRFFPCLPYIPCFVKWSSGGQ